MRSRRTLLAIQAAHHLQYPTIRCSHRRYHHLFHHRPRSPRVMRAVTPVPQQRRLFPLRCRLRQRAPPITVMQRNWNRCMYLQQMSLVEMSAALRHNHCLIPLLHMQQQQQHHSQTRVCLVLMYDLSHQPPPPLSIITRATTTPTTALHLYLSPCLSLPIPTLYPRRALLLAMPNVSVFCHQHLMTTVSTLR